MVEYKVFAILRLLTTKELQKLREFISLKPRQYRGQVAELYEVLYSSKCYLESAAESVEFSSIDKKRLPDLMNKLLVVVEQFCVIESILLYANEWDKARHLMTFLYAHNFTERYELYKGKNNQNLLNNPAFFAEEYLSQHLYIKEMAIHEKIIQGRKISIALNDYIRHIDIFFCIARLKLVCENLSRPQVICDTAGGVDIDVIIALAKFYESESPLVSIYLKIAQILKNKRTITLNELSLLTKRLDIIPISPYWQEEYTSICHLLINFSLVAAKNGNRNFHNKFLLLVKKMEKAGVLLENGIISPPIFKAAISMLLKVGEIKKAESFFNCYRLRLPEKNDMAIRHFCKALISFYKKDFQTANTCLSKIHKPFLDGIFLINMKKLEIQIFVEKTYRKTNSFNSNSDIEKLDKKLRNFSLFLKEMSKENKLENKRALNINKDQRARALNFVSYLNKIIFQSPKMRMKDLKSNLLAENKVVEKDWLLSLIM